MNEDPLTGSVETFSTFESLEASIELFEAWCVAFDLRSASKRRCWLKCMISENSPIAEFCAELGPLFHESSCEEIFRLLRAEHDSRDSQSTEAATSSAPEGSLPALAIDKQFCIPTDDPIFLEIYLNATREYAQHLFKTKAPLRQTDVCFFKSALLLTRLHFDGKHIASDLSHELETLFPQWDKPTWVGHQRTSGDESISELQVAGAESSSADRSAESQIRQSVDLAPPSEPQEQIIHEMAENCIDPSDHFVETSSDASSMRSSKKSLRAPVSASDTLVRRPSLASIRGSCTQDTTHSSPESDITLSNSDVLPPVRILEANKPRKTVKKKLGTSATVDQKKTPQVIRDQSGPESSQSELTLAKGPQSAESRRRLTQRKTARNATKPRHSQNDNERECVATSTQDQPKIKTKTRTSKKTSQSRASVEAHYDPIGEVVEVAGADKTARETSIQWLLQSLQDSCDKASRCCRIVDIGCGAGHPLVEMLANAGHNVLGIDVSPALVEGKRDGPHAASEKLDMLAFFRHETSESFDAVTVYSDGLAGLERKEYHGIIIQLARLLKPGGLLVFATTPEAGDPLPVEWMSRHRTVSTLSVEGVLSAVEAAGLQIMQQHLWTVSPRGPAVGLRESDEDEEETQLYVYARKSLPSTEVEDYKTYFRASHSFWSAIESLCQSAASSRDTNHEQVRCENAKAGVPIWSLSPKSTFAARTQNLISPLSDPSDCSLLRDHVAEMASHDHASGVVADNMVLMELPCLGLLASHQRGAGPTSCHLRNIACEACYGEDATDDDYNECLENDRCEHKSHIM